MKCKVDGIVGQKSAAVIESLPSWLGNFCCWAASVCLERRNRDALFARFGSFAGSVKSEGKEQHPPKRETNHKIIKTKKKKKKI